MQRAGSLGLQRSFLTFIFHSQHNFTGLASPHRDMATNFDIWALGRPVLPLNILPFRLSTAITGAQSSLAARG